MHHLIYGFSQGSGVGRISMVDLVRGTQTAPKGKTPLRFADASSQNSAVAGLKSGKIKANASVARPPGACTTDDPAKTWFCEPCNKRVTNTSDCVKQHGDGKTHSTNVASWGDKPYQDFVCHLCSFTSANIAATLRGHFRREHSLPALPGKQMNVNVGTSNNAASKVQVDTVNTGLPELQATAVQETVRTTPTVRLHHCDVCGLDFDNIPKTVKAHYSSSSHQTQLMMRRDSDSRPDGAALAAAAANANNGKKWITIHKKNGSVVNRLVTIKDKAGGGNATAQQAPKKRSASGKSPVAVEVRPAAPATCTNDLFCACQVCFNWGPIDTTKKAKTK